MADAVATACCFKRCKLVFEVKGSADGVRLVRRGKRCAIDAIEPTLVEEKGGCTEISFDFASGGGGRVIPGGDWIVEGLDAHIEAAEADFSGDGTTYRVSVDSNAGRAEVHIDYIPAKARLFDRCANLALQLVYALGSLRSGKMGRVIFTSESRANLSGNMEFVLKSALGSGLCTVSGGVRKVNGGAGGADNGSSEVRTERGASVLPEALASGAPAPSAKPPKKVIFSFRGGSRAAFYIKTSFLLGGCGSVVVDDYFPLIYRLKFRKSTRVIQLWHACGAFKAVGYSRAGLTGSPRIDGPTHRCYTHAVVSGEKIRPFYAEAFGIPLERVYATGVPRTDMFFDPAVRAERRAEFARLLPQFEGRRIVIFAPTFRGSGSQSAYYPADRLDFDRLADVCRRTNSAVVFKLHPFVHDFAVPAGNEDVFADLSSVREINDLLFSADVLITDYSSVIYEASLLGVKLLFYVWDLEEYTRERDFYEPFERYAAGRCAYDFDELCAALDDGNFEEDKLTAFRAYSMDKCDSHASERVARLIFEDK